jgi:hypothetical protein
MDEQISDLEKAFNPFWEQPPVVQVRKLCKKQDNIYATAKYCGPSSHGMQSISLTRPLHHLKETSQVDEVKAELLKFTLRWWLLCHDEAVTLKYDAGELSKWLDKLPAWDEVAVIRRSIECHMNR